MNEDKSQDRLKRQPRAKRLVRLFAWLALLAGTWAILWAQATFRDGDWGLVNSAGHIFIVVGVLILALWALRQGDWSWRRRLLLAGVPTLLAAIHYLQLSPLEVIHNGDVGIVGWRWRWGAPDVGLEIEVPGRDENASGKGGEHPVVAEWNPTPEDYPRFLGTGYWAEAADPGIDVELLREPPRELWRRKIGAGWSAFSLVGDLAVTQEQRNELELVSCYDARDGRLLWTHADRVRWDPKGFGALGYSGPRATPTLVAERVIVQGATGIVNCLDARTGKAIWSHDTLAEHRTGNLMWGKSGSPLVFGGLVAISVGAPDASLVAYDLETGNVAWKSGSRRSSYASPVWATLAGVEQIVSMEEGAVTGYRASDGEVLWEYLWPSSSDGSASTSQPTIVGDDRVFVSMGYGKGSSLFTVRKDDRGKLTCEPIWSKKVMKTKMGNVVLRDGFVYGLDDVYLQCIELESGKNRWKKRRSPSFGHGQILLVGSRLLILTEQGELVIAEANPEEYRELSSFPALRGLTWNNLALSGARLLVRNAEEAVCFELPLKPGRDQSTSLPE